MFRSFFTSFRFCNNEYSTQYVTGDKTLIIINECIHYIKNTFLYLTTDRGFVLPWTPLLCDVPQIVVQPFYKRHVLPEDRNG